jgi:hypothetical protein
VASVAAHVQALQGVQNIEITGEGIVVIYDPTAVTAETIANAFYLQGLAVRP